MCYILLAINEVKEYPFILAANRDEFYRRESSQLAFWDDKPQIAGGRDLDQGGTWLGLTRTGRFAAITNYREAGRISKAFRSRGLLVTDFLDTDIETSQFSTNLMRQANSYSGYNLIYGILPGQLYYFSNRTNQQPARLSAGIYALSNHLLDTPWPKVIHGKHALSNLLKYPADSIHASLFELLGDQTTAKSDELPNTGIDIKYEQLLSSIYIESEDYGTRCSSVITLDQFNELNFTELTHNSGLDLATNPVTLGFDL